mmetsp:Transcript_51927/g.153081  ORF Transcript_51927/g.153081 Transcript_51927/m.153081 type:complete len:244 (-) Transcript_51927:469-1200(-)
MPPGVARPLKKSLPTMASSSPFFMPLSSRTFSVCQPSLPCLRPKSPQVSLPRFGRRHPQQILEMHSQMHSHFFMNCRKTTRKLQQQMKGATKTKKIMRISCDWQVSTALSLPVSLSPNGQRKVVLTSISGGSVRLILMKQFHDGRDPVVGSMPVTQSSSLRFLANSPNMGTFSPVLLDTSQLWEPAFNGSSVTLSADWLDGSRTQSLASGRLYSLSPSIPTLPSTVEMVAPCISQAFCLSKWE